jgi:uncharacterized membrane protein
VKKSASGTKKKPVGVKKNTLLRHRLMGFGTAAAAAILVFFLAPAWIGGVVRTVAAYDAAAIAMLLVFWTTAISPQPERTAARAALEDPGRNIVLVFVLVSVVAGLASAVTILGRGPHVPTPNEAHVSYGVAIVGVVAGWLLIHTMFLFRYAHVYYFDDDDDNEADRGLTFPGTQDPSDYDFAYFSFVIGMTYQVSDVQIVDRRVRRVVLFHALISFAYSTMILALVVNIVSGLLH